MAKSFKQIVAESVRQVLREHVDEVYQLQTAENLIRKQWESPDDFWYVFVTQRRKDNLNNFHKNHFGDASARFSANYIAYGIVSGNTVEEAIESLRHIKMIVNPSYQKMVSNHGRAVKEIESPRDISAVILLCNRFNARCYMAINKRSRTTTNAYADSLKQRGLEKGREFQFAAGRQMINDDPHVKWTQVRPWGLIDCDIDDKGAQAELEKYLKDNNIDYEDKYESHDGMHYLFSNRDAQKLKYDFFDKKYRALNGGIPRRNSDPMVMFKGDANMILYSATGF